MRLARVLVISLRIVLVIAVLTLRLLVLLVVLISGLMDNGKKIGEMVMMDQNGLVI